MNIIDILIIIYLNLKKKVYFPRTLRFIDFLFILVLPLNLVKHIDIMIINSSALVNLIKCNICNI